MDSVTLLERFWNELNEIEQTFLENPKRFYEMETAMEDSSRRFVADFIGGILTRMNSVLMDSPSRSQGYIKQRNDNRTLIGMLGDYKFTATYCKCKNGGYTHPIEDILGLDRNERMTEGAEVKLLKVVAESSYAKAAKAIPTEQKISKTTVENKVHGIAEIIPYSAPKTKKRCPILFIEADEDHVAEQHGRYVPEGGNKNFISRLAYVYEYKRAMPGCPARKELVGKFYKSGLYRGTKGVEAFWKEVADYIDDTYDTEAIETIYLSGDGASWIRTGAKTINKALYCVDKFHLEKYINRASNQMLDEANEVKQEIHHLLYKKSKKRYEAYLDEMMRSAPNTDPIRELKEYTLENWAAVMRTLHDKTFTGCSAEGHVSHVLSDRLSSRPMGWSHTGADRMSKLRCHIENYGEEKIIDLVRYSRQQRVLKRTGTDNIEIDKVSTGEILAEHYDQGRSYIDRIRATIPGITARKSAAIRTQLRLL